MKAGAWYELANGHGTAGWFEVRGGMKTEGPQLHDAVVYVHGSNVLHFADYRAWFFTLFFIRKLSLF